MRLPVAFMQQLLSVRTSAGRPTALAMRLTRFTDNALRCLMYLGREGDRTVTVGEVASRMAMSEDRLLKVVRRLVDLGYVTTIRGRRGGVRLSMAPERIVIGEVVRQTEDNVALVPCFTPGDTSCPLTGGCSLAGTLDEALGAFFAVLQRSTLADLLGNGALQASAATRAPAAAVTSGSA